MNLYYRILYRKMKTKWANCSRSGNLTVNVLAKRLPQDLIEYIICHEVAHTIERKHNMRFWKIVKERFPDYKKRKGVANILVYNPELAENYWPSMDSCDSCFFKVPPISFLKFNQFISCCRLTVIGAFPNVDISAVSNG